MQLLNTLYVLTPDAWLRLDNDTIRVEVEREVKLRVPLHHLSGVVCMGNVGLSTPLIHRLAEDGLTLVLLDGGGRFKARVEGALSGNVLLRVAQHEKAREVSFAIEASRACVAGKLRNCRQVLLRGARESKCEEDAGAIRGAADSLAASLRSLERAADLDAIRGVEGEAARRYFAALNAIIRPEGREHFRMDGRTRRPPRDRFNAVLSFLYAMLTTDCRSASEAAGLDPQVGFLHALRPGRPALALDLMEELRPLVDRIVITLVNRQQLAPTDFDMREGGGVMLRDEARRRVVAAYQERKQEEVSHPLFSESIPIGLLPLVQARLMARAIRGEAEGYLPFIMR
ncbi:MAG: type I-C CRISPR-associated endonuclease Cas1c [Gammaproteobacteria bacterium]